MELNVHITNFNMLSYKLNMLEILLSKILHCCAGGALQLRFKRHFHLSTKLSLLLLLPYVAVRLVIGHFSSAVHVLYIEVKS